MIVIIIPAKGVSGRLPNKNMVQLNERPMIDYTIDQAFASKKTDAVYVSTDSEEIAAHARSRKVNVIMRDASLGGDTPLLDVYRHALREINDPAITIIAGLQPDHPDRMVSVDKTIEIFKKIKGCEMLYSTEKNGKKNGAHCIVSRVFLESGKDPATDLVNKIGIVDDCTNIHYSEDLRSAEKRLRARRN